MDIHNIKYGPILVILAIATFFWYANETLNNIPILKNVIKVAIIGISLALILNALGLTNF